MQKFTSRFRGNARPPSEFYDAGDAVVVEARYTGTYRATGKKLAAQVCHIRKLRDGKITSFRQYAGRPNRKKWPPR